MKRIIFPILVMLLGFTTDVLGQTTKKKNRQQTVKKKAVTTATVQKSTKSGETISLASSSANNAYSSESTGRFSIADPTINALNQRAAGSNTPISRSGVVGMPKRAYGFANGKILLRSTTAPSSGTMYGSGAVGTGTSISGVGAGENVMGVNGKSPYAGPSLWGSKLPATDLNSNDSTRRRQ